MTKYLCPDCDDHIMLDQDTLTCIVCKGRYMWLSIKEYNQLKDIKKKKIKEKKEQ